ncbi:FAD-binding and (Fe-S)-binding domain-containing protein [Fulvivirga lutimaris]|uniref:FAD-binding and (Fe-S)-binding domain-containing protein n=1 Tax=Fulvivirga lutimaris TaxID=1819566 RepID=UPI0012BC6733|nr:FAD-binding and (Fe-S)-binding domain-containing protein [Fulvivirga lutimaris]MTI40954.1 FAD-binding oxidoreductase [Fulvivirga lutimaris]
MEEIGNALRRLNAKLEGELFLDEAIKRIYSTDASSYREIPLAVALPKSKSDLKKLIQFAQEHKTSLIPRTAGTSLAGQVVGNGIIVDVSKHFTQVLEVNKDEKWVKVQPGVIRDELNMHLHSHDLYFGPETSTANRAMIGGMIGNNSCGSNSVIYGSTREHLIEAVVLLSDGSEIVLKALSRSEFEEKCSYDSLEGELYRNIKNILSDKDNRKRIADNYPKASVTRRNTGYAIDLLIDSEPFVDGAELFNFCKLLAGSEGTLAFITQATLALDPMPPKIKGLLCIHFESVYDSLKGNLTALKYNPSASELMDHYILECTKGNIAQRENRFFVQGDPQAVLVVELYGESEEELHLKKEFLITDLKSQKLGYHFPFVEGDDIKKVWGLRKAGLGLLSNMPGDAKPVPVIEDTAVDVADLPDYIEEFNAVLKKYDLFCVHYAHAGSGELHLRPIIDLKTEEGNQLFRTILEEIAILVKKYKGSLSGEHGDGRLRGEFIPFMIGEENYQLLKQVKKAWDPNNIFNPGKIVDTPSMNSSLRFKPGQITREFDSILNFDNTYGVLRAAEQCNGSGDCRKTQLSGGTMCPSYMATKNEKDTTRARANILREVLTNSEKANAFDSAEIKEVMDLCLSCKGCKSECPSNVDVGKLKAEFQYQYQKANGIPFRSKIVGNFAGLNKIASKVPWLYKLGMNSPLSGLSKSLIGFHTQRSMPELHKTTLSSWYKKEYHKLPKSKDLKGSLYLFIDEFTNYNDTEIGITAVKLLNALGFDVKYIEHPESGRSFMSKGMLDKAKVLANRQVTLFKDLVSEDFPLVGIEPSAILSFRDEYLDLVDRMDRESAIKLAKNVYTFEEFIAKHLESIDKSLFTKEEQLIKLHGHCHQKSLSSLVPSKKILSLPSGYRVELIPSGCCGMAGSFGYEKEHYETSMQIGELVLFPTIRKQPENVMIAAAGTSCRHQIKDGVSRKALHPAEILYNALLEEYRL